VYGGDFANVIDGAESTAPLQRSGDVDKLPVSFRVRKRLSRRGAP